MPKIRTPTPSRSAHAPSPHADASALLAQLEATRSELDAVNAQIERLNRLATMGTIAGMIAHEFNNILTPMLSYAQMAAASPNDLALAQKAVQRTVSGSERAARIAEAILNFVRSEDSAAGNPDVFHVEHASSALIANVGTVVSDSLSCVAHAPEREGLALSVTVPESLAGAIQPIALQQVLVNLILNAQCAMGNSRGRLEIVGERLDRAPSTAQGAADSRMLDEPSARSTWNTRVAAGSWIRLIVRDSGPGIPPDRLARLFTPFRSHHAPGERRGTGLGMVIARRLIHGAGGWITVESALGRGTTVAVLIPEA